MAGSDGKGKNQKLIEARERLASASGEPLTPQDVADEMNAFLWAQHSKVEGSPQPTILDHRYVSGYEAGRYWWPSKQYRAAFRHALRVATDAELGFTPKRRRRRPPEPPPSLPDAEAPGTEAPVVTDSAVDGADVRLPSTAGLQRRAFVLGAASAAGLPIALASLHRTRGDIAGLITLLAAGASAHDANDPATRQQGLESALTDVRRAYQQSRYKDALDRLPALMTRLDCGAANPDAGGEHNVHDLRAAANQVASGLLLKLDSVGMAAIAADRSMTAARDSGNPLTIASSARSLVHVLMAAGHPAEAMSLAISAAGQLDRDCPEPSLDGLSIYGALLLRAALAAARREDADTVDTLLDEATSTARRVGRDANAAWTAFGPTNVVLHRVAAAVALGNAGTAIRLASTVNLDRLRVPERKAMLLLDTAQAFTQWGKYEKALHAVRSAERFAPEEVRGRAAVHRLVDDLADRCPPTLQRDVREYAARIGGAG